MYTFLWPKEMTKVKSDYEWMNRRDSYFPEKCHFKDSIGDRGDPPKYYKEPIPPPPKTTTQKVTTWFNYLQLPMEFEVGEKAAGKVLGVPYKQYLRDLNMPKDYVQRNLTKISIPPSGCNKAYAPYFKPESPQCTDSGLKPGRQRVGLKPNRYAHGGRKMESGCQKCTACQVLFKECDTLNDCDSSTKRK